MSSFGINLDLRLNGQTALDRAIRGSKALEQVVNRINDRPLNLANIGGAARLDKLGELRKKVIQLAKDINKGTKSVGQTEVAVRDTISSFSELAANTEKNTSTFKEFAAVVEKAEKELNQIARATENARRAQKGLVSLEEREAQLERRANTLRTLRTKKKLKEEEARARNKNAAAIDRENKKLERQRKLDAKGAKQNKGKAIGDLAASIGFPLLFGGGIGSVAGGVAGSLAGSALGVPFGLQILGSGLGQGLEQANRAAGEFAKTLTSARTAIDQLIDAVGVRRTGTAANARFAETLGIGAVGRVGLQDELASIVGDKGVKSLEALADSSAEAANSVSQFGAKVTAGLAPVLTAVNKTIATVLGGNPAVKRLKQKEDDLRGLKEAGSQGFAIARVEAEIAQLRRDSSEELKKQADLESKIEEVISGMIGLEKEMLGVEQSKLTARRDGLAAAQGNLAISRIQQELLLVQLELDAGVSEEKEKQLNLQKKILGLQIQTAEAARDNATKLARRQITKEQMSGAANQLKALSKEKQLELKYQQGRQGRFTLFAAEATQLFAQFDVNKGIIDIERKRALIGVTEEERVSSINRDYDLKVRLLEKQFELDKQNLQQANAAYKLSRLQVEQSLKMGRIQAGISAAQQIRATSPFEQGTRFADPFFGDSSQLQIEQTLRYNESLALLKQQLSDVVAQQSELLAPGVREKLEDQENKIRDQIAAFQEYQPAIDQAALAQARFNEAMAVTVPITDSLFDSLLAVVEGTKTAEQAFADFLRSIASMLVDAAKQMIAQYIAIGVARMFAGIPSGGRAANPEISKYTNVTAGTDVSGLIPRANGGPVSSGRPYLVGERGPEMFVPGAQGNIVPNNAMGGGANVTVNVDASGSSVEGDGNQAAQLGKAIGIAVQQELIKQKRPGGLLTR